MSERRSVRIVMEGPGAEAAARDFFSRGWFEAEWERHEQLGAAPVVSADVLAIAGGSVSVAEKMLGWWESWQREGTAPAGLAVALHVPGGARVRLDGASRDALVDVLRVLHVPAR